jgi:hypothetical protein
VEGLGWKTRPRQWDRKFRHITVYVMTGLCDDRVM